MAAFYSTIKGVRGEATKTGTKNSGIRASVQSWEGSLISRMMYNQNDELIVILETAEGSTSCFGSEIFRGTLDELKAKLMA